MSDALKKNDMATTSPLGAGLSVAEVLRIADQDAQAIYHDL